MEAGWQEALADGIRDEFKFYMHLKFPSSYTL